MAIGHDQAAVLLGSLSSLVRATRAAGQRSTHDLGASGTPAGVLKTLLAGDTRPSDLAVALRVAPSVVSRAIVPLESEGLVERTTDPADGRATLISLTALGRARLAQLQDAYVEQVSAVFQGWTDAEAAQAAALLDRLERALGEVSAPDAHRRLLSSARIPTSLSPGLHPSESDLLPTESDPVDSDADTPSAVSTRKPVHA